MNTKTLLILPVAIALLAGCASSNDTRQSSQSSANCDTLTGAALAACQKNIEPASRTADDTFKMVKPKPTNGAFRGGMGNGKSGGNATSN